MAVLANDIGDALVAAARDSITHLASSLETDTNASALAIEYSLIPQDYQSVRHGHIAPDGVEVLQKFRGSAQLRFNYRVAFLLQDGRGAENIVPTCQQGVINAWGDGGYDLFLNHLTDNGSNLRSKNGDVTLGTQQVFGGDPERAQDGQDYNYPVLLQDVAVTVWTKWPIS